MTHFDVLVTGGTSPLGDYVLPALIASGRSVSTTARSGLSAQRLASLAVHVVPHDLTTDAHPGVTADVVVHLAGIRFGGVTTLVQGIGAGRVVAVSSASATAPGHPHRVELVAAEERITGCAESVAILRPTMIYGSTRDRNVQRIYRAVRRLPMVPKLAGGGLMMPVLVDDLTAAIIETLDQHATGVRPVGGAEPVRLGDLLDAVCAASGARRLPGPEVRLTMVSRLARIRRHPGATLHAVQMLADDRVVQTPGQAGFTYIPTPLIQGVALAVSRYRLS